MKKSQPPVMNDLLAQATYAEIRQLTRQMNATTDPAALAELRAEMQEKISFCDSLGYIVEVKSTGIKKPGC